MSSPYPILSICAFYLWIVLKVGPNYMKKRSAFDLKKVTQLYNIYQLVACTFFITSAVKLGVTYEFIWKCIPTPKASDIITDNLAAVHKLNYYFIFLRTSEFIETIFFVLRKKQNQVSALHVYHHVAVVVFLWMFLKYSAGINEIFIGIFNSCIHVFMYSYYLLSSFDKFKNFTNLIKKSLTSIQIIQLLTILVHCFIGCMPHCQQSKLYYLQALNIGFLVSLFLKFYKENFLSPKNVQKIKDSLCIANKLQDNNNYSESEKIKI
jgi:elongation of very long chain fatty acids protein 1